LGVIQHDHLHGNTRAWQNRTKFCAARFRNWLGFAGKAATVANSSQLRGAFEFLFAVPESASNLDETVILFSLPPIIERELPVASRRSGTYWSRVGAAVAGICIFLWGTTVQLAVAPAAVAGRITFRVLAGVAAFTVVASVLELSAVATPSLCCSAMDVVNFAPHRSRHSRPMIAPTSWRWQT
jgi:hypothetical protein